MSFICKKYEKVAILFDDGEWTLYDSPRLVDIKDIRDAQMIIAIKPDGVTDILKNRYGNAIGLS